MLDIGTVLRHYKRSDIQHEMVKAAEAREVAIKFGEKGFGKRPDAISYPNDIIESAKQGATSFHVSEEHWSNVHALEPGLKTEELDDLRIGWDLVLDIDCPDWELSKITAWLMVKALKDHGVSSISCKFSGNKGFHIGVPLKAFPSRIQYKDIRYWFPEGPKRIASYLMEHVSKEYVHEEGQEVVFGTVHRFSKEHIKGIKDSEDELFTTNCASCDRIIEEKTQQYDILCAACGYSGVSDKRLLNCPKCERIVESKPKSRSDSACSCGSDEVYRKFNPIAIIDVDTLLISSRHLYRMPYSLHEKSGLSSVPIDPDSIMDFDKSQAEPGNLEVSKLRFLDESSTAEGEALQLVQKAMDHKVEERIETEQEAADKERSQREYEALTEAIPPELFPPCIHRILEGLEDGRKRSMFILINFFSNTGYGWDRIDEMLHAWNKRNKEQLREVLLKGQVRYRRMQKKKVLPPNCSNKAYYKDLQVCVPDNFCPRIKNPVNYSLLKSRLASGPGKGRQKLTEEQKEMRRKYRERQKKGNSREKSG